MSREDLARRAVAAWQKCGLDWMPGISHGEPGGADYRLCFQCHDRTRWYASRGPAHGLEIITPVTPNIDDHATLGCIEHGMLPAAWPDHEIEVHRHPLGHEVFVRTDEGDRVWSSGWTPGGDVGATLVVCLEAAAERRQS